MVVRPYVGKTRKQDGSSYGCISNKLYDNNELVLCTLKHFLFCFFFRALPQPTRWPTSPTSLTPQAISMKLCSTSQEICWGPAPAISICILAKRNMHRGTLKHLSWNSEEQVPHWMPFCYMLINKHKKGNTIPTIYAAGDILQMYIEY